MRPGRQGLRQRQNEFTSIAPWSTASNINRRQLENSCLTKYRGFRRSLYFLFIWRFKAADWTVDCASDRDKEHRINSSPERSTLLSRRICQPSLSSVSQSRSTTSWRWRASWEASSVLSSHAYDTKNLRAALVRHVGPGGNLQLLQTGRGMAAWLDRGSCRGRFRLRRVSRLFPPKFAPMPCCDIKSFFK